MVFDVMRLQDRTGHDMTGINESQNCTQSFCTKIRILGKICSLEGNTKIDIEEAGC